MKLEARFTSHDNKLYKLDGSPFEVSSIVTDSSSYLADSENAVKSAPGDCATLLMVTWASIGFDEESYNESFLAELRDVLKALEEAGKYAVILPSAEDEVLSEEQKEAFIAGCKHCARRIKDASSVIGFAIPKDVNADFFIEELSAKHKHYIYFSNDEALLKEKASIVRF